jgi:hypothetical protein
MQSFLADYSDAELDTIVSFVVGARAVIGEQIAALRRLPRERRSAGASGTTRTSRIHTTAADDPSS